MRNIETFRNFLQTIPERSTKSRWIDIEDFSIYTRKGQYYCNKKVYDDAVVLANLIKEPGALGNGSFTTLLPLLVKEAKRLGYKHVVFENVFNARLESFLKRRRYKDVTDPEDLTPVLVRKLL